MISYFFKITAKLEGFYLKKTQYYFSKSVLGKPNISEVTCSLHGNSVKLRCDVFLYDESPALDDLYWIKNGKQIFIATNDEKYARVDKNDPSLTINNVDYNDAGDYKLIAINPVGETWSKVIVLGNNKYNWIL